MSTVKISEYTGNINASEITASKITTSGNVDIADNIRHLGSETTKFGFSSTVVHRMDFFSEGNLVLRLDKANGSRLGINSSPVQILSNNIQLTGPVTASGNISSSGTITAEDIVVGDDLTIARGGILNMARGTIKSALGVDHFFIDGTDGASIFFNDQEIDVDVQIRGANGNYYFKADADAEKVGIGGNFSTTVPGEALTVHGNISASGNISATNLTLVGDATINGNLTFGNSTSDSVSFGAEISSSIIPDANNAYTLGSPTRRWSSISAHSSSFNYISASHLDLDEGSLSIGGERFTKTDITNLKAGRSISTTSTKQVVHQSDDTTFVQMKTGAPGRVIHKVSNVNLFDMQTSSFEIGDPAGNVPLTLQAKNLSLSGSTTVTGSFTVTDLLTVLADYGQTGSFSVSGSTTLDGDVNADGAVTVTDLLTVLGGFGVSGSNSITGSCEISGSLTGGSPPALVITGSTEITGSTSVDGPFVVNDLLNLLANYGSVGLPTGSGAGNVSSGDINLDGQVNVNDLLLILGGMGNPNIIPQNLTIPNNVNHQLIGPQITVSQSVVVTVGTDAFLTIT